MCQFKYLAVLLCAANGYNAIFGKIYRLNNPVAAIVILNFNGKHYLQKFLPAVLTSTYPNKKIVVADNGSVDGSVNMLKTDFPTIEIIQLDKNYGFAEGYNRALAQVQADYFILLNSDVEVVPGWIEPVLDLMESDANIAACQPKILAYNDKRLFEYAGACGGWLDAYGFAFSRGRVFDICEPDNGQYNDAQQVFWASGAAMFVRAEVYTRLGGLDPYFFAHMEEIDLCWRMQLAGYTVMCCPASIVYHIGGGTLPKGNARKVFLNFRNNLIMMCKNLPWYEKFWKLPFRIMLDIVFALKNLLAGQTAPCGAVFKAHFAVIDWMLKKKIQGITPRRKPLKSLHGVYNSSIVWQHFVRKKTTFSEIVKKKLP